MNHPTHSRTRGPHGQDPEQAEALRLAARSVEVAGGPRSGAAGGRHTHGPRANPTVRMRRPDGFSRSAHDRGAAGERGAARRHVAHLSWPRRAGGGARCGHRTFGWRASAPCGSNRVAREVQQDSQGGSAVLYRGGPMRRAQPRDQRGSGPFGLYYAPDPSSQIACTIGGNVAENSGRRALPEVRPDAAQRAARARPHRRRGARRVRLGGARCAGPRPCWPSSSAARACSP